MHILFIGYGKTSQCVAKQLFQQCHQITTVSLTAKADLWADHLQQDIHQLDLTHIKPVNVVYVLLAPYRRSELSSVETYQNIYVDSVQPIINALKEHPVQRIIVVSSTRVYGEDQGQIINDDSQIIPKDQQGHLLLQMEQLWQRAYPQQCIIVRPSGIYGTSIARMLKLAESTHSYPNIHWSNRIHIEDLSDFLSYLIHVEHPEKSYICSDQNAIALHEIIVWFQAQLGLPKLKLKHQIETGKKIIAQRMLDSGFKLKHPNAFDDYAELINTL